MIVGATDVTHPKPEPDMITLILTELSVEPCKAVFVDDTSTGLTAIKRAGTITVGITTGFEGVESIRTVNPDYVIGGLGELVTLIERRLL
jgi:phosphoglycolate phosphatase